MSSVDQTLRRAKQIEEKFKEFMSKKQQRDKSMKETFQKINKTQQTIKQTKSVIGKIDETYDKLEETYSQVIDKAVLSLEKNTLFNVAEQNFVPNRIDAKKVVELMKGKKKVMILTGAGISAASGIPTFRGNGGFWNKEQKEFDIEDVEISKHPQLILTYQYYSKKPYKVWQWLSDFHKIKQKCKPNKGHHALSQISEELQTRKKQICLVTQNIDNYHREVKQIRKCKNKNLGDYQIHEIHGNIMEVRCQNCNKKDQQLITQPYQKFKETLNKSEPALCPKCSSKMRPHIMFFDEFYEQTYNHSQTVNDFLTDTDLVIVIGTSLQTGLASSIVQISIEKEGRDIIQINKECEIKRSSVYWLEGDAEKNLEEVKFALWKA